MIFKVFWNLNKYNTNNQLSDQKMQNRFGLVTVILLIKCLQVSIIDEYNDNDDDGYK